MFRVFDYVRRNNIAYRYALFVIIFLAVVLRITNLSVLPSGFYNDEASFLYNAQTILHTGKDEDGRAFPLYLNSFIDPKPALYSYLQIPFVAAFGPTVFAARLPAVILGVMSIFFVYRIVLELLGRKYSLLVSLLLAISPWHIMLSRGTQEVIMSFAFSMIAIYLALYLLRRERILRVYLLLFFVTALLAMYSYHSAKIFLPLFLGSIAFFHLKKTRRKLISILLSALVVAVFISVQGGGTTRFQAVSIFTNQEVQLINLEQTTTATPYLPYIAIRMLYNKVTSYSLAIMDNYMQYFTAHFLFFKGGLPDRYAIPFHGLFYHIELVLVAIGIIAAFLKRNNKGVLLFLLSWLFFAPLPAAMTVAEVPSMIRSFPMIVPLIIFVAYGLVAMWEYSHTNMNRLLRIGIVGGYLWGVCYFFAQFGIQQPVYHPWQRQYADMIMAQEVRKKEKTYKKIVITNPTDSYIYFAINGALPMEKLQSSYPARLQNSFVISQYTFIDIPCPLSNVNDVLFVVDGRCKIPPGYKKIQTITYKDGVPKFLFVKYAGSEK